MGELKGSFDSLLDEPINQTDDSKENNPSKVGFDIVNPDLEDTQTSDDTNKDTKDIDIVSMFLKDKGIEDPSKIKFENEEGEIEEIDFSSLDKNEQLELLKELNTPDISEYEMSVVSYLRENGSTLEQVIEYFQQKAVDEFKSTLEQPVPTYAIDEYSDDEIFVADTKNKFPSMSDEELEYELTKAKENVDLFNKKIGTIRQEYIALEEQSAKDQLQSEQDEYNTFATQLKESAMKMSEISLDYNDPKSDTLIIEDAEKQEVIDYLLTADANGVSQFFKDLNDPDVLVELAWYRLKGKEAISGITDYWKDMLKKERKSNKQVVNKTVVVESEKPRDNNMHSI